MKDTEFEIYHGDTLTNVWDILRELLTAMTTMTIGGMSVLTTCTCLSSSRSYTSAMRFIVSENEKK